jgi:hypothetical protein
MCEKKRVPPQFLRWLANFRSRACSPSLFFIDEEQRRERRVGGRHLGSHPRQLANVGPAESSPLTSVRSLYTRPRVLSLLRLRFSCVYQESSTRVMTTLQNTSASTYTPSSLIYFYQLLYFYTFKLQIHNFTNKIFFK